MSKDLLTKQQKGALGRAISCYLEQLEDSDEQQLIREIRNKLDLRLYLTDTAAQLL